LRAAARVGAVGRTFRLFDRNHHELKRLLDAANSADRASDLYSLARQDDLELVLEEALRLLHNFVAAAVSFRDHVDELVDARYRNTAFSLDVSNNFTPPFASPLARFVFKLRNYVLHFGLPATSASMKLLNLRKAEGGMQCDVDVRVVLHRASLLNGAWDEWDRPSKEYLSTRPEPEICLATVADEYHALVVTAYEWINARLLALHADELAHLETLWEQLRMACGPTE
jgi:hypothetical protein